METGSLEIELEAELNGKTFRDLWICSRGEAAEDAAPAEPPFPVGCPSRTHFLSDGGRRIVTPFIPAGSVVKITSSPTSLRFDIAEVPGQYEGTDAGRLDGGSLILFGDARDFFGTLVLKGKTRLGAQATDTDRVSTISGRYEIRGLTPWGIYDRDMRVLRSGDLLAGAYARFVDGKGNTAAGSVVVTLPDPDTPLMRVTAISEPSQSNLGVQYYFTDEVVVSLSTVETLILDPFIQLALAGFGAIAGYGWLKRLKDRAAKKS